LPTCARTTADNRRCTHPVADGRSDCGRHPSAAAPRIAGGAADVPSPDPFDGHEPLPPGVWPDVGPDETMRGGLLGVHVGDSLGATTEFNSRERAAAAFPDDPAKVDIVGGGVFGWRPGDATDDSDLTKAVDDAYATSGPDADHDQVVRAAADNMAAWYRKGPRDIGGATAEGLSTYVRTGDPHTCGATRESSQGNGSLMRTLPVALAHPNDPDRREADARAISAVTHATRPCQDACVAYTDLAADIATRRVSNPAQLDARLEQLADDDRLDPSVRQAIRDGIDLDHISDLPRGQDGSGWVNYSLIVSVWAVRQRRPAPAVLLDVVRHGGDADTNGAIAGGLLGVRDGAGAWPERWRDTLQHGRQFDASGSRYAHKG
jgi:ADP-ribosylglycohydrolase